MAEETQAIEPVVQTVEVGNCPSLSERSNLTYEVGMDDQERIHLRITGNSGGGYYSQAWVAYEAIEPLLSRAESLSGAALKPLFQGTSVNTAGFVMAALKHLGVVVAHAEKRQTYVYQVAGMMKLLDLCSGESSGRQTDAASKAIAGQSKGKKGTAAPGAAKA